MSGARSLLLFYRPRIETKFWIGINVRSWLIASADGMPEIIELNSSVIG